MTNDYREKLKNFATDRELTIGAAIVMLLEHYKKTEFNMIMDGSTLEYAGELLQRASGDYKGAGKLLIADLKTVMECWKTSFVKVGPLAGEEIYRITKRFNTMRKRLQIMRAAGISIMTAMV